MNIHFYLNDKEETPVMSFYDLATNPFKKGDVVSLTVDDLVPAEYNQFKKDDQEKVLKDHVKLQERFRFKKLMLLHEGKYVKFNTLSEPSITIEYHCELI